MSNHAARILYCHCAYAKVVPPEVKAAVLNGLAEANAEFDAVPDLCEMAARGDERLRELAAAGPLQIAACYPRAVKWLFAAAGARLADDAVRIWNMRVESADTVIDGLVNHAGPAAKSDQDTDSRQDGGALPGDTAAGADAFPLASTVWTEPATSVRKAELAS
jgi:hypothetical protein